MPNSNVTAHVEGALGFLDFQKNITGQTWEAAPGAYDELVRAGVETVALNFSATTYIDSKGTALLINLVENARQARRKVLACGLSAHYQKIFGMVGLSERMTLCADEREIRQKAGAASG